MAWKIGENIDRECFSEAVLLEYFYYLQSEFFLIILTILYSDYALSQVNTNQALFVWNIQC